MPLGQHEVGVEDAEVEVVLVVVDVVVDVCEGTAATIKALAKTTRH
jgi:hypothetical protein